ncbi:MAG: hypothetical protein HRT90_06210, partial [Candidatus Margulisbacteria bacterium]|nr:hypothetical protein [Candidatus Margulisiibacteriota bacterium]
SRRDETGVAPRVSSSQKVLGREVANTGVVIRNELQSLLPRYEDIIIDAGGADNEVLRAAMTLADVVVFPILASEFDMWTFGNLSNLIASAQGKEDKLRGSILINKVNTNPGTSEKEIEDCQEFLSDYSNLYAMDAVFHSRVSIKRAQGLGRSVVEYKPHDTKAIKEIEALYAEVFNND